MPFSKVLVSERSSLPVLLAPKTTFLTVYTIAYVNVQGHSQNNTSHNSFYFVHAQSTAKKKMRMI